MRVVLFIYVFLFCCKAYGCYEIDIPHESNCVSLNPKSEILKKSKLTKQLDAVIKAAQRGIKGEEITSVTPREAQQYFSDYLVEQVGPDEAQRISPILFTEDYFGDFKVSTNQKQETIDDVIKADPYFLGDIQNMLYGYDLGLKKELENPNTTWRIKTRLLTPEQAREAYQRNYPWMFNIVDEDKDEGDEKVTAKRIQKVFSSKYFLPEDKNERQSYFLTHSFGFFSRDLVKSIYGATTKIMQMTKPGDTIVIFGNTPYFVGRALNFLISQDVSSVHYRKLIEFPFSGAPNAVRHGDRIDEKDIVTPERLAYLKKRMTQVGLSVENPSLQTHQLYILDAIDSGAGPAYVIEELFRDFRKASLPLPSINLLSTLDVNIINKERRRNHRIADQNANDGEQVMVTMPSKENPHFTIPLRVVVIYKHHLLDNLPSTDWRVWPEWNACYWQEEYESRLQKREHLPYIKTLFEFFDTNLHHLISNTKKPGI